MPYITEDRARDIEPIIEELSEHVYNEGELNYAMTRLAVRYIKLRAERVSYSLLNTVHGTFFSAAAEFYRKRVAPYEQHKATTPDNVGVKEVYE